MPSSELTFGRLVGLFLLSRGIALAVLVVFALVFTTVVYTGHAGRISGRWIALVVYTSGLFWVTVRQSREYWRSPNFWLAIVGMLVIHLLAFVAILRASPQWQGIWFMPIVIVEGGLFGAILYLLFGIRRHSRKQRNKQAEIRIQAHACLNWR